MRLVPSPDSMKCLDVILACIIVLFVRTNSYEAPSEHTSKPLILWEEEEQDVKRQSDVVEATDRRRMWWIGRLPDLVKEPHLKKTFRRKKTPEPHPLRMESFQIHLNWKKDRRRKSTMHLEFNENGYLRAVLDDANPVIGTWRLSSCGLSWDLCLHHEDPTRTLHFYADLHVNPFGNHPKLTRGMVLGDYSTGRKWFRPVVATFSGIGVGTDTVDLSYRLRK